MFWLMLWAACTTDGSPGKWEDPEKESGDADADADADGDADSDADSDTLPDIRDEMQQNANDCQDFQGNAIPGGRAYYWGEFIGNETDGWEGEEKFYLFTNDTLKSQGFDDCEFTWSTVATLVAAQGCQDCELGLSVTAVVSDTTCDPSIFTEDDLDEQYSVDLVEGGAALWYFPSGNDLGGGYWDASGVNYLTDSSCVWF